MSARFDRVLTAEASLLNLPSDAVTRRTKVAILGMTDTVRSAPWGDPEWEIWGCNNLYAVDPWGRFRADRWFELHPREIADDQRAVTQCRAGVCYVINALEWSDAKNQDAVRTFPKHDVMNYGFPYFASTFSWEVALAIHLGFETIGVFGVDLLSGREGLFEKASLAYWLGIAQGRGIEVVVPKESWTLWHPALYGFDYWAELEQVGRLARLAQPTIQRVPDRPPGDRPQESYDWERRAIELWPQPLSLRQRWSLFRRVMGWR